MITLHRVSKFYTNQRPRRLLKIYCSSHQVNLLVVPHQKSNKYSVKAFPVVGPRLWNELLTDELRGCNSVDTFKKKLKTLHFKITINIYYIDLCFVDFFCDYVKNCNSNVNGFTQHVSYFLLHH